MAASSRAIPYSERELAYMKENCTADRKKTYSSFCVRFNRPEVTLDQYNSKCKREGWLTGRNGQYNVGVIPANKGKKMPYNAKVAATQFKKGQVPHNIKPIGHERIGPDGYVLVKVDEQHPHFPSHKGWYRHKQRVEWEKAHGPIPKGMFLKCLDSDKANTDPSNWVLLERGILARLNEAGYDNAPVELKQTVMVTAQLVHAIGKSKRG